MLYHPCAREISELSNIFLSLFKKTIIPNLELAPPLKFESSETFNETLLHKQQILKFYSLPTLVYIKCVSV